MVMLFQPSKRVFRRSHISLLQFFTEQNVNRIHRFLRHRRIRQSATSGGVADKRARSATLPARLWRATSPKKNRWYNWYRRWDLNP